MDTAFVDGYPRRQRRQVTASYYTLLLYFVLVSVQELCREDWPGMAVGTGVEAKVCVKAISCGLANRELPVSVSSARACCAMEGWAAVSRVRPAESVDSQLHTQIDDQRGIPLKCLAEHFLHTTPSLPAAELPSWVASRELWQVDPGLHSENLSYFISLDC